MSEKDLNNGINEIYEIVRNLDPNRPSGDSFVDVIETESDLSKSSTNANPVGGAESSRKLIVQLFSYVGTLQRAYFIKIIAAIVSFSAIILLLLENNHIDGGWGVLILAVVGWVLIASVIKRWRDTGYNPWWLLSFLIPYAGLLTVLFVFVLPTKKIR